jgi:hypothetical protein
VLRKIWQPDAAQAQTDVQALADELDINLDAASEAADRGDDDDADSVDMPGLAEDDDDWGDEDDDADYETESESESEAAGGGNRMDDRKPPRAPTLAALQAVLAWTSYAVRKARRAVRKSTTVTPQAGCVDPKRRILRTSQFWDIVGRAVKARSFAVPTKHGPVTVPRDGGFLLQAFRALGGLTDQKQLKRAKNEGRSKLEGLFRMLGRKYTGLPMDMALYSLTLQPGLPRRGGSSLRERTRPPCAAFSGPARIVTHTAHAREVSSVQAQRRSGGSDDARHVSGLIAPCARSRVRRARCAATTPPSYPSPPAPPQRD